MLICLFLENPYQIPEQSPNRLVRAAAPRLAMVAMGIVVWFASGAAASELAEEKPTRAAAAAASKAGHEAQAVQITMVQGPPTEMKNPFYVSNRPPLAPSPFLKLPIGSIKPQGWLRQQLLLARNGMVGRLKEISPWLRFEESAWANKDGQGKHGWEEMPYWLKGFGDLGYVLDDPEVIAEAKKWIEAVMASQREDGWFGPRALLTALDGKPDLWPHMVMLNVLQSYYEYSGDRRVLDVMTRYFEWQNRLPVSAFGEGYWPRMRAGDNIESVLWLYNRTGQEWLLELARKIHAGMARWDEDIINWHNVNLAQGFRAGTVFWMLSQKPEHLASAERNYTKLMDMYGQFPGGGFVGDENCRPGFTDPRGGIETCGIVEFMHSFQMLLRITGQPIWADRCEEIALNSFPAAMTPDLKGLHYITCANQVQLDRHNKSPGIQNSGTMFSYSPFECYRCCQHNVSHGWPYYAEELWLATPDGGLAASLYAASEVEAQVGDGTKVQITEETDYPFDQTVRLRVSTPKPVRFPLYLRLPRWCKGPQLEINGLAVSTSAKPLSFLRIERTWQNGDTVSLRLPMEVQVRTWTKNHNAVSVDYGPLSFSIRIRERWQKYVNRHPDWPEWEVFPDSPWNYGLELVDLKRPAETLRVVRKEGPLAANPWTPEDVPIWIQARGRKIPEWQMDERNMVGPLQACPALSSEPIEEITLIPMGAARLRIACIPTVTAGPEGHRWQAPSRWKVSASHCFEHDTLSALNDGLEPKNSNDHSIPRMTWWPHRGTAEWVQYEFEKPRRVAGVAVYWFDDTGQGQCRLPQSWRLLYRDGDPWKPVPEVKEFPIAKDRYSQVRFPAVETTGLRLEVQLQEGFSGGILEWKVLP